jgi:hypothetical protein
VHRLKGETEPPGIHIPLDGLFAPYEVSGRGTGRRTALGVQSRAALQVAESRDLDGILCFPFGLSFINARAT